MIIVDYNSDNYRLDSVKIYANEMVIGIQCTYEINGQSIKGEKFFGSSKDLDDTEYEVKILNLDIDEFIVSVSGRSGSLIDKIRFVTNKGRELEAGGEGGSEFDSEIPEGTCVGYISGGRNGDLHNLKFLTGPLPMVLKSNMKGYKD